MGELAQHSEALGSLPGVNHEVVHRDNAPLLGKASSGRAGGFGTTRQSGAPSAAMRPAVLDTESAEGIVVADPRAVSGRRRVTRPVKDTEDSNAMKART